MRNFIAVAAGVFVGLAVPAAGAHIVQPFALSGQWVLSWEFERVLGVVHASGTAAAVAVALVAAVCLPGLVLALSEVVSSGRSARRAATLVLLATGALGLCAPGAVGAFVFAAIAMAALFAVVPGHWASIPLGVFLGLVAGAWWVQAFGDRWWMLPHAELLADLTGATPGVWAAVLAFLQGCLLTAAALRACRAPARGGQCSCGRCRHVVRHDVHH